ncbi:MAG TPA: uroporphyrinogen decarboxylase family protein [Phycisphaerae bacterium]|nr:uroporphyrinogen decarboxylase family protein [Phycisphaerae bacterium]
MTPREVVTRAIEFRRPPRLPVNGYGEASDVTWVPHDEVKPAEAEGRPDVDQWLCRWGKTDAPNMGQVKGHPLEDLAGLDAFPWPDGDDPRRYAGVPQRLADLEADARQRDKYVVTGIFMILWERMHSLHGFENSMIDLVEDRPEIHELADRILEFDLAVVRNMHRLAGPKVQGFSFTEDWGTERDVHISPALWRRFFFPRYRKLFAAIHDCGWHVWMHSCGKINRYLAGLIEAGCDVINMQQPRTNGIDEVGREFAGRICFETLCDIQKTLPVGDRDEIVREAEHLMRAWGTDDGGFILGDYGDHAAIGADPEVKQFMLSTFVERDRWRV